MHIRVIQPGRNLRPILSAVIANQNAADFDGSEKSAWRFIVGGEKAHARSQLRARREAAAGGAEADAFQFSPSTAVARAIKRRRYGAGEYRSGQREQSVRRQARHVGFGALPLCATIVGDEEPG